MGKVNIRIVSIRDRFDSSLTKDSDLDKVERLEDGRDKGRSELQEVRNLLLQSAVGTRSHWVSARILRGAVLVRLASLVVVLVLLSSLLQILLVLEQVLFITERLFFLFERRQGWVGGQRADSRTRARCFTFSDSFLYELL